MTENLSTDSRREELLRNLAAVKENVARAAREAGRDPSEITLMAVTKTMPAEDVNVLIDAGISVYGENRVQELLEKQPLLHPCEAHFIGTLQKNKVRHLIGRVHLIQSVGSLDVLSEIDKRSAAADTVTNVLLEINVGREPQKSGFLPEELPAVLEAAQAKKHVFVKGLMAIPPVATDENEKNRAYFEKMRQLFIDNRSKKSDNISMCILSMGMSRDYTTAIACGSTLVRVGTGLFGQRTYQNGGI